MDYIISDLHLGDKGIIHFERTEFNTVEEHDAFILSQWNKTVVNKNDKVFFLGDLHDNSGKPTEKEELKNSISLKEVIALVIILLP